MSSRTRKRMNPVDIRFTYDSIHPIFKDGRDLEDTLTDLKEKNITVDSIPIITIVSKDGLYFSIDNRRLWVFKEYAKFLEQETKEILEVPVKFGDSKQLKPSTLTTTNEGEFVAVRPKGSKHDNKCIQSATLSDIRYSAGTLNRFWGGGSTIYDKFDRFSSKVHESEDLPVLRVVKRNGTLYALDNLQLWMIKRWFEKNSDGSEKTDDLNPSADGAPSDAGVDATVFVELRPYHELADKDFKPKDEGRTINIKWNEQATNKVNQVKFKPLTRQSSSQERKDVLKYCQSYEKQAHKYPNYFH